MLRLPVLSLAAVSVLCAASDRVLIRTVEGALIEGQAKTVKIRVTREGKLTIYPLGAVLSVHLGTPATPFEAQRITAGLAAIAGKDRASRDQAVEELTSIGVPVLTPLIDTLKDTDQHEPRPLYRLFERVMPSYADGFDRTLSLIRLASGETVRGTVEGDAIVVATATEGTVTLPWMRIRMLAVQRGSVRRTMEVHSIRHSTQVEYMDTGVIVTPASKVESTARGFARLSWNEDGWASDADGLQKPGPRHSSAIEAGHPFGALVGRVGAKGEVLFFGKHASKTGLPEGRLTLAINDSRHWENNLGTYFVTLTATEAYDVGDAQ